MPDEGRHLWRLFWRLSRRRKSGPEPLSHDEILAWCVLSGTQLMADEVESLTDMDDAMLGAVHEQRRYEAKLAAEKAAKAPPRRVRR